MTEKQSCKNCFKYIWNGDDDPSYGCDHYWELEERGDLGAMQAAFNSNGRDCNYWQPNQQSEPKKDLPKNINPENLPVLSPNNKL